MNEKKSIKYRVRASVYPTNRVKARGSSGRFPPYETCRDSNFINISFLNKTDFGIIDTWLNVEGLKK